jgi:hypothetical protein
VDPFYCCALVEETEVESATEGWGDGETEEVETVAKLLSVIV